ncbi:MAG: hypothetical protein CMM50_04345 [Rhodospirillaceae bacterium]|nr:hypothetical protein [Rhodospirillaceae bacterium]
MAMANAGVETAHAQDAESRRSRDWLIAAGVIGVLVAVLVGLYWNTAAAAVRVWIVSPTYNHCFLIVPISAYLMWERRSVFSAVSPYPFLPALILIPGFSLAWLVADTASVMEIQHFALVGLMEVVFLTVLGWSAFRALLFPLLYLFFLVPSGDFMVPYLQDFAAAFAVKGLQILDIPVYSDGIFIMIPNGRFEVAEACAGLRFLIAAVAFGFLFANLVYRSYRKRLIFVVLSFVVPVIANGFRVVGIILLAHFSNNRIAVGADHLVYGWGFFTFVLLVLIFIGLRFREDSEPLPPPPAEMPRRGAPLALVASGIAAAILSASGPAYSSYIRSLTPEANLAALTSPTVESPWQRLPEASDWVPVYPTADATLHETYTDGTHSVDLFVAYYLRQRDGAEVVAHENRLYDDEIWHRAGDSSAKITFDGERQTVGATRLVQGDRQRVVVHWNWIDGEPTASKLTAKILQAHGELLSGRRGAAKIALSAEYEDDRDAALAAIDSLLAHLGSLDTMLTRVAEPGS